MSAHTPGPWLVDIDRWDSSYVYEQKTGERVAITYGERVAITYDADKNSREAFANARLIAQAPAMLDALRLCEIALRNYTITEGNSRAAADRARSLDSVRAILAAIEGQS